MHRLGKFGLVRLELVRIREQDDGVVVIQRLKQPAELVICSFRPSKSAMKFPPSPTIQTSMVRQTRT